MDEKNVEHLNIFKKLVALRKQLPQGKEILSVNPKQVAQRNNVSSSWNKMKFLKEQEKFPKKTFHKE
jgi:hypothetical protein